jgi:hypothetical protein
MLQLLGPFVVPRATERRTAGFGSDESEKDNLHTKIQDGTSCAPVARTFCGAAGYLRTTHSGFQLG